MTSTSSEAARTAAPFRTGSRRRGKFGKRRTSNEAKSGIDITQRSSLVIEEIEQTCSAGNVLAVSHIATTRMLIQVIKQPGTNSKKSMKP
jgi:broad specificity phosphatase PhoE